MTVKSLDEYEKQNIANYFCFNQHSISELAVMYGKSRRTIIRTLEEMGVDPGVKHRVKKEQEPASAVPVPRPLLWNRFLKWVGFSPRSSEHRA